MSSAICLNFDQSKILSFVNRLNTEKMPLKNLFDHDQSSIYTALLANEYFYYILLKLAH